MSAWYFMLCVFVLENTAQCLQLKATPNTLEPGKTESLTLNCTFTSPDLFRMRLLYTLTLSHSFDNISFAEILATASLNNEEVYTQSKDDVASGVVTSQSESYLWYQLHSPYYHHAGNYICQAYGIGFDWRPLTLTAQANIFCSELSLKTLSEEVRVLRLENIHLAKVQTRHEEKFSEMDRIQAELFNSLLSTTEQLDGIKTILGKLTDQPDHFNKSRKDRHTTLMSNFYESESFEGRRYYLKKSLDEFAIGSAQSTCEWYGGYLAEIDNDLELEFVRDFVRNYDFPLTWITGSDEVNEGHWINTRTNMTLKYLKWGYEVSESRKYNCLLLDKDHNWLMNVAVCSYSGQNASYICEILE